MFSNRELCIATMHQKDSVIGPILENDLGVRYRICESLNTDLLGTFSGEIDRTLSPLETAKEKCLMALNITGGDLVVASEGSFGPHPSIPFIPCDEEYLVFIDNKNSLEISVKTISTQTNFWLTTINNWEELIEFCDKIQFPSHAIILKDKTENLVAKGINNWESLKLHYTIATSRSATIIAETDMRAHLNPTRMSVIKDLTTKLVAAIKSNCPNCLKPGFIVKEAKRGLPCELCGMPTRSTLKHIRICNTCKFTDEILFPYNRQFEEATYCDFCNP